MRLPAAVEFWKARAVRLLFALHRWLGVTLGILMLVWCMSGMVMIFVPYPSMNEGGRNLQREGLAPLRAEEFRLPDIAPDTPVASARVEMRADTPILRLATESGPALYDLGSGEKLGPIDDETALAVAATYARRHNMAAGPTLKQVSERDEFSVGIRGGPFRQVRLNDPAQTMLYIDARGDIRQQTTASSRFWNWLGSIPHWLYFTELRKNGKLWADVIVWTSLGGSFLAGLGLFVGIRQLRRRRSTGRLASPYREAKMWHHWLGLVFGVLALTWLFSGLASMNPWGWLNSKAETSAAADRYAGEPPRWAEVRAALEANLAALPHGGDVAQLQLACVDGQPWIMRIAPDGHAERFSPSAVHAPLTEPQRQRAAALLAGDGAKLELLAKEDAYYYGERARLPVLRISTGRQPATRFYVDPETGSLLRAADPEDQAFRWWHMALHTLDFAGWMRREPAHAVVSIILMAGVTALCAIGAWIGLMKLARLGRLDNRPNDPPGSGA